MSLQSTSAHRARLAGAAQAALSIVLPRARRRVEALIARDAVLPFCERLENRLLFDGDTSATPVTHGCCSTNGVNVNNCGNNTNCCVTNTQSTSQMTQHTDTPLADRKVSRTPFFAGGGFADGQKFGVASMVYGTGKPEIYMNDLTSSAFGKLWGQSRMWDSPGVGTGGSFTNGNNWYVLQAPQLLEQTSSDITKLIAMETGLDQRYFVSGDSGVTYCSTDSSWTGSGSTYYTESLAHNAGANEYTLTDATGGVVTYYDYGYATTSMRGQFKKFTDAYGNTVTTTYSGGSLQSMSRSGPEGTETWNYTYLQSPDPNAGKLSSVQLIRAGSVIQQVSYTYYTSGMNGGNLGDLEFVTTQDGAPGAPSLTVAAGGSLAASTTYYYRITALVGGHENNASTEVSAATTSTNKTINLSWTPFPGATGYKIYRSTASGGEVYLTQVGAVSTFSDNGTITPGSATPATVNIDTTYYRYYTSNTLPGYVGGLKWAFGPSSYSRLLASLPAGTSVDNATDSTSGQLAPYADNYFEYDSSKRVTKETVSSGGCGCTGNVGQGVFSYSYSSSANANGYNNWAMKTVETFPDGSTNTVYTNYAGEVMLKVFTDNTTGQPTSGLKSGTFYVYDSAGRQIEEVMPSAVIIPASLSVLEQYADLLHNVSGNYQYLRDSSGVIHIYDYGTSTTANSTTAGDVTGYFKDEKIQQGETGTAIFVETLQYFSHVDNGNSIYPVATDTMYRNTNGTGGETTSFSYAWYANGPLQAETITSPTVTTAENGPGTADVQTLVFDMAGRVIWSKDADGYVNHTTYDPNGSGAVVQSVTDALPYVDYALTDGPLGYWRLNDMTGSSTALDSSGNSNNATYFNSPSLQQAALIQASDAASAAFGSSNGAAVTQPSSHPFDTSNLTFEAWIKPTFTSGGPTYNPCIGGLRNGTPTRFSVHLQNNYAAILVWNGTSTYTLTANGTLAQNGVHLIDVTFDGTNFRLFVDGSLQSTTAGSLGASTGLPLRIGASDGTGTESFPGQIEEVAYFGAALSASQAAARYSAGQGSVAQRTHLALTTSMQVDEFGRTTKLTDPNGNVTYTIYNDPNHETRVYPGWTGSTTTGPIEISREYRPAANAPLGQQTVYQETITSSATPTTSGGVPTGFETIDQSNIQSLSRNLTNSGNQVFETDNYSALTGITYSTANAYLGGPTRVDGTTLSSWSGTYGANGYDVAGYTASWPAYLTTPTMPSTSTWTKTSGSPLLFQPGSGTNYSNTYWSSTTSFSVDLSFTDSNSHQVALYLVDADAKGYKQRIDVLNVTTGALLDVRYISNFSQGEYLVYNNLSGHVKFTFTNLLGGSNQAVLSGLFFDNAGTANYYPTDYGFDTDGRKNRVALPTGTIQRTVYDSKGHALSQWIGTNDTGGTDTNPAAGGSPNNMVDITDNLYDRLTVSTAPPAAPTCCYTSGGTLGSSTYYATITYTTANGETAPAGENSLLVPANNLFEIFSPSSASGVTGYNVYVGTSPGSETKQNGTTIAIGTNWTESTGGLISGAALPPSGIGEADLTQVTQHPGGGASDRIHQMYYDWRDRLVADKSGVQSSEDTTTHRPIIYRVLDNLGEVVEQDQYDGDQQTVTYTSGIPNAPSSSLLRVKITTAYDEERRPYLQSMYSVDQSTGTASTTSLNTNTFYDHRGNVIEVSSPGGMVTKDVFDGAGRRTIEFQSDGAVINSPSTAGTWAAAGGVTNDIVLSQDQYTYDADGNVLLVTHKDRFDNDSTTGGALGDPTTSPNARVSYAANWYDAANRPTDSANFGTNAGVAYTSQTLPPQRTKVLSQATATGTTTTLVDTSRTELTGYFVGYTITILSGTDHGSTATVTGYNAATGTLTFSSAFASSTDSTSVYTLTPSPVTGVAASGSTTTLVDSNLTQPTGMFVGYQIKITSGTDSGKTATATGFNASTHTLTFSPAFSSAIDSTSHYSLTLPAIMMHTDYDSAGRAYRTVDPRGVITQNTFDLLGRTTKTVVAYDGGNPSNSADQTTTYTYDGDNKILTMTAVMPSGTNNQTTAYVYGTGGTIGTNIFSNDLLAKTEYPDKTTGSASTAAADDQTLGYDFLGEKTTFTDQNGTLHTYSYDILGRLTADTVTTLGTGVDGAIRRLGYTFDTAGRPYQQTSYSDTGGTTIVNQVQDAYNGLGQLIAEYQNHTAAVNTSTTPAVLYNYSQMLGSQGQYVNNSRLLSIVDPNGRSEDFLYGGTNAITSLTSSGTTATVTTGTPHGLVIGSRFTLSGATPTAFDGTFTVTSVVSPTQFTYTFAGNSNNPASGPDITETASQQLPITSITHSGTTATATSAVALGLTNGTVFQVVITGASPSAYNGTFNATVTGSTTFTYTMSSTPGSNATGADIIAVNPQQLTLSSITFSGTTATGTSSSSLGMSVGTVFSVSVTGASPSGYDGLFTATVTGSTTFTYTMGSNPGSNASGTNLIAGLGAPQTLDGAISRISSFQDHDGTMLESYNYLGQGTIVQFSHPQTGIALSYVQQLSDTSYVADAGDRYTGLDRFGRISDQFWTDPNHCTPTDRYQYAYDHGSNVLYQNNIISGAFSELYHSNSSTAGDNNSAYDALGRLTNFRRGTLSASANNGGVLDTVTTLNSVISDDQKSWSLDALGNWNSTTQDGGGAVNRTTNSKNEVTAVGASSLTFDNNGNTTKDETGNTYTYDAWNRLKFATLGTPTENYTYDALGRRIHSNYCNNATFGTDTQSEYYYSKSWQLLEDDTNATPVGTTNTTTTKSTYVWSRSYIDDMVSRDQSVNGGTATRLYVTHTANHDVTGLLNTGGTVQERFTYDPYGTPTGLNTNWTSNGGWTPTADANGWLNYHQGGRLDVTTNLYSFRIRDYSPTLGRWIQQDPGADATTPDLYEYGDSAPLSHADPLGLISIGPVTLFFSRILFNIFEDVIAETGGAIDQISKLRILKHGDNTVCPAGQELFRYKETITEVWFDWTGIVASLRLRETGWIQWDFDEFYKCCPCYGAEGDFPFGQTVNLPGYPNTTVKKYFGGITTIREDFGTKRTRTRPCPPPLKK